MTIEFNCPRCDKVLRTTDDKAGRQAKCPGCGELITIPEWSGEHQDSSFVSEGIDQELPPVPSPLSDRSREMKSCPMCGVETRGDAIRCRSCGEVFKSESRLIQGRPSGFREMRPFPPGEVISEAWRIFTEKIVRAFRKSQNFFSKNLWHPKTVCCKQKAISCRFMFGRLHT